MSFELFIAKRYLKSKRRTGFISIITYISIGGVTIGVTDHDEDVVVEGVSSWFCR